MGEREAYLLRAADLSVKAQAESDVGRKFQFEKLARAYLRLAANLERNSDMEIVRQPPPKKDRDQT